MSYYGYTAMDSVVGLDTIVGANDMTNGTSTNAMQASQPSQRGNPRLVPQRLDEARELLLGFGPTLIAGGGTSVFTTQPQLPFRPSRFVIPSTTVTNFSVNDLKIGKNSQFLSSNSVPAAVFSELAVGVALGLDTCNVGQQITVSITAGIGGPFTFAAALIGTSLQ
jgi:hypothetical protein